MNLHEAPYISLGTFRKSGVMVATPVWAAPVNEGLMVFSAGHAGKVKRLRNSPKAQIAVCDVRGKLLGEWQTAQAFIVEDEESIAAGLQSLRSKYGWQMWLADTGAKLTGKYHKRTYILVRLST
ncbi:MAG: PPOX class F420-dependent oxidoreductase [Pseudomonadota bacterium]